MVEPTKRKPRFCRSLLMASDSFVFAGTRLCVFQAFCFGVPPTNAQIYLSKLPNSLCTLRKACALLTAASTFSRLRMIPASLSSAFFLRASYRATFAGSNPSNTSRYRARFFKMVSQLKPACAPSRIKNSKSVRSSCTGTPHSASWYGMFHSLLAQRHRAGFVPCKAPMFPQSLDLKCYVHHMLLLVRLRRNLHFRGRLQGAAQRCGSILLQKLAYVRPIEHVPCFQPPLPFQAIGDFRRHSENFEVPHAILRPF